MPSCAFAAAINGKQNTLNKTFLVIIETVVENIFPLQDVLLTGKFICATFTEPAFTSFKFNNRNTRIICKICETLLNFEQILHIFLVFPVLNLNK